MSVKEIMPQKAIPLYNPAQLPRRRWLDATQKLLRFGVFELNLDTEELRKDGTLIKLAPQPFRLLAMLASHAGQVVTREEIQKQIWGDDTFVDFEHGMNQCIKQIRSALNDNADRPLYVETIPRHGYRFLAPVVSKTISVAPAVVESKSGIIDLPPSSPPPSRCRAADRKRRSRPLRKRWRPRLRMLRATAAAPAPETAPQPQLGRRSAVAPPGLGRGRLPPCHRGGGVLAHAQSTRAH